MPAARARARPGASSTFDTTTAMRPPSVPARSASMSACRFDPRPEMRTPTAFTGVRAASFEEHPRPLHDGADHVARLPAPLQRVFNLLVFGRCHAHDPSDPHTVLLLHI